MASDNECHWNDMNLAADNSGCSLWKDELLLM